MLQAPIDEVYQHAVLSLENRKAQREELKMGGWVRLGSRDFKEFGCQVLQIRE